MLLGNLSKAKNNAAFIHSEAWVMGTSKIWIFLLLKSAERGEDTMLSSTLLSCDLRPSEAISLQHPHSKMNSEVGNITTMSVDYEDDDFVNDDGVSYNVSPDVPHLVYIMFCVLMAPFCVFGVVSNASIFVLFFNSPLVSLQF